ncbi:unnamed protein product [Ilex paraguariensis]|uniref:Uncharacterized protein n=1 Tax=Ilex paraguariensis TaxID=185542 RepID=A0ABC8TQ89_9AQUA
MAVEPTTKANVGAAIMLTSGASGPVNALLSLRALKSLAMLIHAFVLLLLLPFRGRKRCMTTSPSMMSSSLSSGCSDKGHNKEEKLHDKKGKTVARVPARIVPLEEQQCGGRGSGGGRQESACHSEGGAG